MDGEKFLEEGKKFYEEKRKKDNVKAINLKSFLPLLVYEHPSNIRPSLSTSCLCLISTKMNLIISKN